MRESPFDWTSEPGVEYPTADDLALAFRNLADWLTAYTADRVQTALQLERDRLDSEIGELRESVEATRRMMLKLATDQLRVNQAAMGILAPDLGSVRHDSQLRKGDAD